MDNTVIEPVHAVIERIQAVIERVHAVIEPVEITALSMSSSYLILYNIPAFAVKYWTAVSCSGEIE